MKAGGTLETSQTPLWSKELVTSVAEFCRIDDENNWHSSPLSDTAGGFRIGRRVHVVALHWLVVSRAVV
jgi:hypothetical protein